MTHREEKRPADGGVPPVRLTGILRRAEDRGAHDEYPPPLHQIPEVVGVARVLPQACLANAPTSVGLVARQQDNVIPIMTRGGVGAETGGKESAVGGGGKVSQRCSERYSSM